MIPDFLELVYAARVAIDRSQMDIENKRVNLSAGMAVTVKIKNGSRSIISCLLSPLLRCKQESMRERRARSEASAVRSDRHHGRGLVADGQRQARSPAAAPRAAAVSSTLPD